MKKPNSQMQTLLSAHAALHPIPIETLPPLLARQIPLMDRAAAIVYGHNIMNRALTPMPLPVGDVRHIMIPGTGHEIMARVYTPTGDRPPEGWPIIVYYHGGGWVIAGLETYDASCRALCQGSDAVVVSVHYRQAPEYKWPAAPNDAFAAYQWVQRHADVLAGDATKIAVAGESAGGNLAAVTCLMARDRGIALPLHQLLVYPVTDLAFGTSSPSALENMDAKPLNTPMLKWFYNHYLPEGAKANDPYISPLHANVEDLPPATVLLADIDPLRSDGEAYAEKLGRSGVAVDMKIYDGVCHEFFGMAGLLSEATSAMETACANLSRAFDSMIVAPPEALSPGVESIH